MRHGKSARYPKVVGLLLTLAALFTVGFVVGGRAVPPRMPAVRVYEDGSGVMPNGVSNPVLGDLSGRPFCLSGQLCAGVDGVDHTEYGEIGSAVGK